VVEPDAFARAYLQIFHMAERENWPAILERGLLSTSELLDLYGYTGAKREAIEARHRPDCVTIQAPGLPSAVIRDPPARRAHSGKLVSPHQREGVLLGREV